MTWQAVPLQALAFSQPDDREDPAQLLNLWLMAKGMDREFLK